ncbi:hypothetical protein B0H66DRAFT_605302 [Apodospora peruviana]|uniref:Uncharacterized protein n=1 Tax=Apodospora peruviana TaxID=516989 RepID=A0AAE0I2G6_9PEZI|nr:hypothetical protein B0H66DRAFT_605302 [Apodospora peruviana]
MSPDAISWIPPGVDSLNYTKNCTTFARFVHEVIGGQQELSVMDQFPANTNWMAASTETTVEMLRAALPPELSAKSTAALLMQWYLDNQNLLMVVEFEGNSDLIGQGVITSYLMEACMVVFYTFATFIWVWRPTPRPARSIGDRMLLAFRGTLSDFKRSAAVFALTVLAATFVNLSEPTQATITPFEIQLASLVSIFSCFAVYVLTILETWITRRRSRLSAALCVVLLTLNIIEAAMTGLWGNSILGPNPLDIFASRFCVEDETRTLAWELGSVFYFSGIVYFVVLVSWCLSWVTERYLTSWIAEMVLFRPAGTARRQAMDRNSDHLPRGSRLALGIARLRRRPAAKAAVLFVTFGEMYAALVTTMTLRYRLHFSDEASRWTFGQVLAVGTWIPVMIEWSYIFLYGMKEGLEGRMPDEYGALYVSDAENGPLELEESGRDDNLSSGGAASQLSFGVTPVDLALSNEKEQQ